MEYTLEDLTKRYESRTAVVRCQCTVTMELVGGQPADESAVRAFAEHHLKITDPQERDKAVQRILHEEVGEHEVTPEQGELQEKKIYGVNVIRRSDFGPWLGNWQVKACFKQAASRLKIFTDVVGSKGSFAESGRMSALGLSLVEPNMPFRIHLRAPDGKSPARTYFKEFMGRVTTPKGSTSIIHHSECVESGSRFEFEFRFLPGDLKETDIRDVVSLTMICGLGSVRSMECGKFAVDRCSIEMKVESAPSRKQRTAEKKTAEEKIDGVFDAVTELTH